MSFTVKTTVRPEEAANFIVLSILKQLELGKRVLFFVTGGSSMVAGVKVAELLRDYPQQNLIKNLTITLTDERYGLLDHPDSNWYQLVKKGFALPSAKLIPILINEGRDTTVKKFGAILHQEFSRAEYKIGLFGIGTDGHMAGILPESGAVKSENLTYGYETPTFFRITITSKAIEKLDEAVVWVQGENKWNIIKNLQENSIEFSKQPVQILKKIPLLTIFTDYKKL